MEMKENDRILQSYFLSATSKIEETNDEHYMIYK